MSDTLNAGDRIRIVFADTPNAAEDVTVCATLTDRQEGLSPEIEDYVACWIEISSGDCSDTASRRSISLGTDFRYSLDGRELSISKIDQ